ncbi:MAG: class I SAM-dependent methyltransferase [Candidatus Omnitrophica bacterium]|nr:class I SAM-dependent methyltransferase [Candidatus Omnitrophota bacterium]
MSRIERKEYSCEKCVSYDFCKHIEERFHNQIIADKGNWREIYDNGQRVGTPIRRCAQTIFKSYESIFFNKQVLEIGCGCLSELDKQFCQEHKVNYVGIDPGRLPGVFIDNEPVFLWRVQNKVMPRILKLFNVKKYRLNKYQYYIRDAFPSEELEGRNFDLIYGNSTIEHWHEKESSLELSVEAYKRAMDECYRLLKQGGILLMNCPIYVHGNILFMRGEMDAIEGIFENGNWRKVTFEYWRRNYSGLMPYCPQARKEYFNNEFGIDLENIWLLNIVAKK